MTPCRYTALGQACAPGILSWGEVSGDAGGKARSRSRQRSSPGSLASNPQPALPWPPFRASLENPSTEAGRRYSPEKETPDSFPQSQHLALSLSTPLRPRPMATLHWRETSGDWGPFLAPWCPTVGHEWTVPVPGPLADSGSLRLSLGLHAALPQPPGWPPGTGSQRPPEGLSPELVSWYRDTKLLPLPPQGRTSSRSTWSLHSCPVEAT